MPATTGYQAGNEANQVQLSYGVESVWGTPPASTFQAIRLTSESLTSAKTRKAPSEIITTRENPQQVTTQVQASGTVNFALSFGTYDDVLSVLLGSDWQAAQAIAGVAGDITLTNVDATHATLSSTTASKFQNIAVGQFFRSLGFTNSANNDIWRCTAKADNQHVTGVKLTTGAPVTETPAGTAAQLRAQTIQNGTQFKSLFFQKRFSSALWLRYPGAYISSGSITGGTGSFLTGSFDILAQQEINQTTDASTGGVLAAPTGSVNNPVGAFKGVFLSETALTATVDSFTIKVDNTGAALEFGMGSASAAGILMGTLTVSGTLKMFFKDFTYYQRFINETQGALEFVSADNAGNAYVITLLNAALMNPQIVAGGPNQAVYATFTIEGDPQTTGGTIQIDKLPAT